MRYSKDFIKTSKEEVSAQEESLNARLLLQAGYINKEIAGVYSYLPLGMRVLRKIEDLIRRHMDQISTEIFMPTLQPKESWEQTRRYDTVDVLFKAVGANKPSRERNKSEYVIGPTHEEIVTPLVKRFVQSYKDLPVALYQIQSKFRNEARAKSGLLRGREFRMKDLYSFHTDEADLKRYYEIVKQKYNDIFAELGIGDRTFVTLASGGDFTDDFSHEFQTLLDTGEDEIYLDRKNNIAYNKEVVNKETEEKLGVKFDDMEIVQASEVGNIFPLNVKFSKAFDFYYTDENNNRNLIYMGCYGIGPSRTMGVLAEIFNDKNGLCWPESVAPFKYHLLTLGESDEVMKRAEQFYTENRDQVLWDDRAGVSAGEKFNDADLIGCPYRVLVSERSLHDQNYGVEISLRSKE